MSEGLPPLREFLLREVLRFVRTASTIPGVTRIALVGSLATTKPNPKDADVLVSVTDDVDLARLATAGRTLKGRAQTRNSGADIFWRTRKATSAEYATGRNAGLAGRAGLSIAGGKSISTMTCTW
jgi:hypothetical protein